VDTQANGTGSEVSAEFARSRLGDVRLEKRLMRVVDALSRRPDVGFPRAMPEKAELEAFYRFIESDRVEFEAVLASHKQTTIERMAVHQEVVVVHDTTEFRFTTARADLGRLRKDGERAKRGFLTHFALAVSADDHRDPLGVIGAWPWMRTGSTPTSKRRAGMGYNAALESEQARWARGVKQVHADVPDGTRLIHVMDSEADDYALLATMVEQGCRFVIRQCYDRRIELSASRPHGKMKAFIETFESVGTRSVRVSRRRSPTAMKNRRRNLPREGREAVLSFSATPVALRKPSSAVGSLSATVAVNVVRVWEEETPDGVEPLEWLLLTTEPIETAEQIMRVVDTYRIRWTIEEFFKAIKSGCAFEKRQLESFSTLATALAIFIPIAWSLLRLRSWSRTRPTTSATDVLTAVQLEVLRRAIGRSWQGVPSVREALLAVAALGGHLERNGEPGWQTIGRGFEDLLMLEAGFRLATSCDQS
jgi:Transposase DNA-binding/Transposase DDE domain